MMKKLIPSLIAFMGCLIFFSSPIKAQDETKTEKKLRIKTVKVENGKRIETDTTIVVSGEMDYTDLEKYGISSDAEEVDIF